MSAEPVSVVIVSYNTLPQLRRCLHAVEREHEVIVVDNASSDGSPEMVAREFPWVRLVRNDRNLGFGAANNVGLSLTTRSLVLFLNSDCYAEPGAISLLTEVMGTEGEGTVAAGGHLLNADGSTQRSTANRLTLWAVFCEQTFLEKLLPGTLFDPYWNTGRLLEDYETRVGVADLIVQHDNPVRTDEHQAMFLDVRRDVARTYAPSTEQVMGACLMIRPVERFDERFFLYCEDTDLCRRLRRHGDIVYVPSARFTHELGASSGRDRWRSVARYNRGKELYFRIHHGPLHMAACWAMNRMGALLRLLVWSLVAMAHFGRDEGSKEKMGLFFRVLTAAPAGPDRAR